MESSLGKGTKFTIPETAGMKKNQVLKGGYNMEHISEKYLMPLKRRPRMETICVKAHHIGEN